jgi:hypothetical protein
MAYTVVEPDIPSRLVIGESVSWKWTDSDFPASSWTLTYTLINASAKISIVASADGDDHLVEVTTGTSAAYTAGEYDWQAHVDDGADERYKVAAGVIEIVADFAANATLDARSHAKIMLDGIEAALEGRATKTQLEQSIGGVRIEHMTHKQLIEARAYYAAKYRKELIAEGKATSRRTIKARFV